MPDDRPPPSAARGSLARRLGLCALLAAVACGGAPVPEGGGEGGLPPEVAGREAAPETVGVATGAARGSYAVSPLGGTPATGPGLRYNACERIWCARHEENFFVDHYLEGHPGWILHDEIRGDVWVPPGERAGPALPDGRPAALRLCGRHVHPWVIGGRGGPVRTTGYNHTLGYSRGHFAGYGTRLDPCCTNGLGWAYLHSRDGRRFRFHDVAGYRANPDRGWQKPFAAAPPG